MKLERISAAAQIELPKANPLSRSHEVWKMSALAPDRKRTSEIKPARMRPNLHACLRAAIGCLCARPGGPLRRGVAGFFPQILDHQTQTCIQIQLLQHLLTARGLLNESRCHQVCQHREISHVSDVTIDFFRQLPPELFKTGVKFQHLCPKRVGLDRGLVIGLKGFDFSNGKRMQLQKMDQADSLQTLQDQVGSAVTATDTGANQTNRSNIEEVIFVFPFCTFGSE